MELKKVKFGWEWPAIFGTTNKPVALGHGTFIHRNILIETISNKKTYPNMKGIKKTLKMRPRNAMFTHRRMKPHMKHAHVHPRHGMHAGRRLCGIPLPRLSIVHRRFL